MAPLTPRILIWHTIKTYLFYRFYKISKAHLKSQKLVLLSLASLLSGTVIYKLIDEIADRILCWLLNMETMSVLD